VTQKCMIRFVEFGAFMYGAVDPKKRPKKTPNASETLGKRTPNLSALSFLFSFNELITGLF